MNSCAQTRLRTLPSGGFRFFLLIWPVIVFSAYPEENGGCKEGGEAVPPQFFSIVSSGYGRGSELSGWNTSRLAIQAALQDWYGPDRISIGRQDPLPEDVRQFFSSLPGTDGAVHLIYIGARCTAEPAWRFTTRKAGDVPWVTLLNRSAPPVDRSRLIILDVCHAESVVSLPVWKSTLHPVSVLSASTTGELTYELNFSARQPVDLSKRFPETAQWLKNNLPADWDGRISYLGFIWVRTFLQTEMPPQSADDWLLFFKRCEEEALIFRQQTGWLNASTVRQISLEPIK